MHSSADQARIVCCGSYFVGVGLDVVGVGQAIKSLPFLSAAGALQQRALLIARIIVLAMFALLLGVAADQNDALARRYVA